jgi:hypothetical protein
MDWRMRVVLVTAALVAAAILIALLVAFTAATFLAR